jgi:NAD(P)-dependent dehydrogenase (short-subunit alcohol dehydrogenase family)
MIDISGKTAIVTGAASGIGLGIATALAEAGAKAVMADIQKDAVEQAAHGRPGTNKRVMPVRIDVTQEQSVVDALAEAERNFGKLHIACNNAGVPMHGSRMIDVPPRDWEFVIGVKLWGIIHGIRHFVPAVLKHGEEGRSSTPPRPPASRTAAAPTRGRTRRANTPPCRSPRRWSTNWSATNIGVSVLCTGPINTNIAWGARNRSDHTGGPQIRASDEAILSERLATIGLDPKKVGERVVDAIRTKTFYAFVGAVPADVIRARHRRIEDALNSPWVTHY